MICMSATMCCAQTNLFQAKYLESTAQALGFDRLDTISAGSHVIKHNDADIIVVKNKENTITHIGKKIFAPTLREEHPSPIYNYLEFALLDHLNHFTENPFVYKDLKFIKGGWNDFSMINDSTAFGIETHQNKLYVVKWYLNDSKTVEVMFPINYERLSLVNRKELEQNIIRDVKNYVCENKDTLKREQSGLKHIDADVWVEEGKYYLSPEINNNKYFTSYDSLTTIPLNSKDMPVESIANWCVMGDMMGNDCVVDVKFVKYDYTQESISIPMSNFVAYMKKEGCTPYWGVENRSDKKIEGALFLNNKDKGFDHILKIDVNLDEQKNGISKINAIAYLLSPTTNIKDIHYNYNPKPKKLEIVK